MQFVLILPAETFYTCQESSSSLDSVFANGGYSKPKSKVRKAVETDKVQLCSDGSPEETTSSQVEDIPKGDLDHSYTKVGVYKGSLVAVKKVGKELVEFKRKDHLELKSVSRQNEGTNTIFRIKFK